MKKFSDSMKEVLLVVVVGIPLVSLIAFDIYSQDSITNKDYQAACIYRQILTELMIHMDDREKSEAEEVIYSVLENLDCYPQISVTKEELETNYRKDFVQ